jgi:hypothetical protein
MKRAMATIALAALSVPVPALAWLGGDAASIKADRQHMNATVVTAAAGNYTRFEIHTPSGTLLTEYLSPSGRVFAVAWKGPALPDLRQALGGFFSRYIAAGEAQGLGRRVIEEPGLVVHAGGHMRAFVGRAFIPESIPQGVSVEDIR